LILPIVEIKCGQSSHTLDCSPAALKLSSNEYITDIRFEFGTVKAGFQESEAPSFIVTTLATLPDGLEGGDTLIVTELDRLGRNKDATLKELRYFKDNNIRVMILEIPTTLQNLSKMENSMASMIMDTINNKPAILLQGYCRLSQRKRAAGFFDVGTKICRQVPGHGGNASAHPGELPYAG